MTAVKAIGIKNLKDNLSAYLREIKDGICILVTDRGNVVAELKQPDPIHIMQQDNSLKLHWINGGYLKAPLGMKQHCHASGMALQSDTASRLLAEERAE